MAYVNTGYNLRLYFNTGFNGVDIPSLPSVLENAQHLDFSDTYYIRQDLDTPSLMVKANYDDVKNADYARLTPITGHGKGVTCFYFCTPSAMANNTVMLSLDLDALLTMGGAENLTYISGWQERGHIKKSDDKLFYNTAGENFAPSRPLVMRGYVDDILPDNPHASGNSKQDIIVTSVDLDAVSSDGDLIDVFVGMDNGNEKMYFPKIKLNDASKQTEFSMTIRKWDNASKEFVYETVSYKIPNTTAYLYNDAVKNSMEALFSAGQLSLLNSYTIPSKYLASIGHYTDSNALSIIPTGNFTGQVYTPSSEDFAFEYDVDGYTVKNKKAFTMFSSYAIGNVASGGLISKDASELWNGTHTIPRVILFADPSPTGKPFARFAYILGSENPFADAVAGCQWYTNQLAFEGASGSMWNTINATMQSASLSRQMQSNAYQRQYIDKMADIGTMTAFGNGFFSMMGGATSMMQGVGSIFTGDIAGGIGQILGGGASVAQSSFNTNQALQAIEAQKERSNFDNDMTRRQIMQAVNENRIGYLRNNNVIAPSIMYTPTDTMSLYGYNRFTLAHVTLSDDDLKELDAYFQRYGYNGLHKPLTAEAFKARKYYNFVQAFDINIKSTYAMRIREKAIAQLNQGVRVWRVLPDATYYETN